MGLLDSIREVLGLSARTANESPVLSPSTAKVERPDSTHATQTDSIYLPQELHSELLKLSADGKPPLRLVQHNGALWLREESTKKLVNVDARLLPRLGIWGAKVRGYGHYERAAAIGPAELVREPENPHDSNAVAVYVRGTKIGFYNKGTARRLAKLLDSGELFEARMISADPPKVLAASPGLMQHLDRRR